MAVDDDEEKRKQRYFRVHIQSLYNQNQRNPDALKAALEACAVENPRMRSYCDRLINAVEAKKEGRNADYDTIITELTQKKHPTYRAKLAKFFAEKHPEIPFNVEVPALEDWTQDEGKDKTVILNRLNNVKTKLALSPELEKTYDDIVKAYKDDRFDDIKTLRENCDADSASVVMLFAIRDAICYDTGATSGNPRGKLPKHTFLTVHPVVPGPRPRPAPIEEILNGYTSDEWKQILDGSKDNEQLPVYLAMTATSLGLSEGIEISSLRAVLGDKFPKDFDKLSKEDKDVKITELRDSLNAADLAKFNIELTSKALSLAEAIPPHQLTVMTKDIDALLQKKYSKKENTEELRQQLENLQAQKDILVQAMITKTAGYAADNIIVDQSNIADVYDGANEMFAYLGTLQNLSADTKTLLDDCIAANKAKLDAEIKTYDQDNGLTDIKEEDAAKLEKSFDTTWKIAENIDFSKDTERNTWFGSVSTMLDGLKFEGSDAAEKKATFIETIKLTAARNAALKNPGKNEQELADALKTELNNIGASYYTALVTTDALAQLPENATQDQRDQAVRQALATPPATISDKGTIAFQAATVNDHVSLLNRLAEKNHLNNRKAAVLSKIYGPLKKIDKACIARFGTSYIATRSFGQMMLRNMGAQTLNQALRIGCNMGCLAFNAPGIGSQVYAAVYASMAVRRFYKAYKDEKATAKANGKKYGFGKFLLQKAPEIALTAAGTAASFFGGAIAQHGAEAVVRYGMMGAGWLISFSKGIYASKKQGNGWLKSIGKAFTNASFSTGMAVGSSMGIAMGVNHFSGMLNNISTDLWGEHGTRQPTAAEYNPNDPSYSKDPIDLGDQGDAYKNMTEEQLNEAGIIKEGIPHDDAERLVAIPDEKLAEEGIVRSETVDTDPDGVKVIDEAARTEYSDNAVERAENIVKYWTSANPEVHQSNMAALNDANSPLSQWNASHPTQVIDANRLELIVGDAGGQMVGHNVDTLTNHVNGDMKNEHALEVKGNHRVFGEGWLAEHKDEVGVTQEDIDKIAALHGSDGKIDTTKLTPEVLAAIDKIDRIVSSHNEVLDTEVTRKDAHTDGFLHRNADIDKNGTHVHSDDKGKVFNTYADGESCKGVTPEKAHWERFDRFSQVLQHSFVPFTVTFDRFWDKTKGLCLNMIMGANGKRKEKVNADGSRDKPAAAKPVILNTGGRP